VAFDKKTKTRCNGFRAQGGNEATAAAVWHGDDGRVAWW
jgi:hypothetical protein